MIKYDYKGECGMFSKILKIMIVFILMVVFLGCNEVTIKSIEISEFGNSMYYIGETFNPEGYKLTINYSDGSKKEIDLETEMCDLSVMAIEGKHNVNVTYVENGIPLTTSFEISIDKLVDKIKPISIAVIQEGKKIYSNQVELDLSGYLFKVDYSNGTSKEVVLNNSNADITSFPEVDFDTQQIINLTYTEDGVTIKTSIEVTVMNEWDYEDYILEMQFQEIVKQIEDDCNKMLPTETTEDITLPEMADYNYKVKMVWSSSEPTIISPAGTVVVNEDDKNVILTLKIHRLSNNELIKELSFDIFVKGLGPVIMPEIKEGQKLVFAYFYEGTYSEISSADAQRIDVINYCFARVTNGVINISELSHLKQMMQLRRDEKIRIVLSIGGGASVGFSEPCSTSAGRKKLIDSIMDVIKTYKFDGIDMDWEYPGWSGLSDSTPEDPRNFSLLLKELRAEMDAYKEGLLLTSAVISSSASKFYEPKELDKYLDYVHIMTYDGNNTGIATHHTKPYGSGYSAENAIKLYLDAGVRPEKLVIGAAFYGKISELTTPQSADNSVLGKPVISTTTTTIRYTNIYKDYLSNSEYQECYDSSTGAYFLTNGKYFITYDNPLSIQSKVELVEKYNLGGMMFWDYGSDETGSLLKAVYNGIEGLNNN